MAKNATLSRYAIRSVPKSDRWWLEYQEGVNVLPEDTSYRAKRVTEGIDAKTLQKKARNEDLAIANALGSGLIGEGSGQVV